MGASPTVTQQAVWTCPTCGRQFRKTRQVHSCTYYPIEKHLAGKSDKAIALYNSLIERLHQALGDFYIESLPCCIHLVSNAYTFAAVYVLRADKIRLHLASPTLILNPRIDKIIKVSNKRYAYSIGVSGPDEIDDQLLAWIRQSFLPSLE